MKLQNLFASCTLALTLAPGLCAQRDQDLRQEIRKIVNEEITRALAEIHTLQDPANKKKVRAKRGKAYTGQVQTGQVQNRPQKYERDLGMLRRLDYFWQSAGGKYVTRAVVRPAPVKPAKGDAVRQALAEAQRTVRRAQGEADLKAMQEELDKAEKALMKARQELWKRLRAQQTKRKETGGSKSKPASRPASGEPPAGGDSRRGR